MSILSPARLGACAAFASQALCAPAEAAAVEFRHAQLEPLNRSNPNPP